LRLRMCSLTALMEGFLCVVHELRSGSGFGLQMLLDERSAISQIL